MSLLIERLTVDGNHWGIQVMQHALSLLSNVPLRLLLKKKLFDNVLPIVPDDIFSRTLSNEVVENYKDRRNTPWLTIPSNMHPVVQHLRANFKWLAWEHILVGQWLKDYEQRKDHVHYFHESMHMAAYPIKCGDYFDGFLVVGPCFAAPGDNSDQTFYEKRVKPFVDLAIKLGDSEPTYQYDRDELLLLGASRGWIKEAHLQEKTTMLGKVMETLFNTELQLPVQTDLERCTYNQLAQMSFLINREDTRRIMKNLFNIVDGSLNLELVQRLKDDEHALVFDYLGDKTRIIKLRLTSIPPGRKIWVSSSELSNKRKRDGGRKFIPSLESLWTESKKDQVLKEKDDLLSQTETLWRELGVAYGALHFGYAKDSLTRFENWLNNIFGLVSTSQMNVLGASVRENMYFRIAREVTRLFTADTTTIYIYDYPKKELDLKFTYFQENLDNAEKESRREALRKLMDQMKLDHALRNKSISYRCVTRKQPRFCRAWNLAPDLCDPKDEPILQSDKGPNIRSAIAVPMVVNRRVFGVVEIGGYSPYQFRFANVILAQDIGNVLGTFLYQKEFMGALNYFGHTILDLNRSDEEKYTDICRIFTGIFEADAAVLYLPRGNRQDEYQLVAWCNRPDLDKFSSTELTKCILKETQENSPLMKAIKSKTWGINYRIRDLMNEYPNWLDELPQRKALPELFDWQVAVPVKDPRRSNRYLCGVYLYFKIHTGEQDIEPLSEKWKPTVDFIARYVAFLISTLQNQKEQEEKIQNILRHELRQMVDSVAQRAEDIVKLVSHTTRNAPRSIRADETFRQLSSKVGIMYRDLSASQKMLSQLAKMLEAESFRNLLKSGLDPMLYLISEKEGIDIKEAAEDINIRALFNEIWKSMGRKEDFVSKRISYKYSGFDTGPIIRAKKTIVRRIFDNLFNNAVKYSFPNNVVEAHVEESDNSLIIHIINSARSLSAEEKQSIFEYSFRGSNVGDIAGDGIGLSVARKLCEVLEASIQLNMAVEKGKKRLSVFDFAVSLPINIVVSKIS